MPFELLKTLPPGSDQYRQIAQLLSYLNSAAVVVVPHFGGQEALQVSWVT